MSSIFSWIWCYYCCRSCIRSPWAKSEGSFVIIVICIDVAVIIVNGEVGHRGLVGTMVGMAELLQMSSIA